MVGKTLKEFCGLVLGLRLTRIHGITAVSPSFIDPVLFTSATMIISVSCLLVATCFTLVGSDLIARTEDELATIVAEIKGTFGPNGSLSIRDWIEEVLQRTTSFHGLFLWLHSYYR